MATKMSGIQIARRITLGVLLAGFTVVTILHQKLAGVPSVDALCPFGGIETVYKFFAGGDFIRKLEPGNIVLLGGIVALGVVLSRFFCGWFCAFGALQGAFGWLGKKLFKMRFTVPPKLDSILRWAKYPILVAILWFTWRTGELVIRPYDPVAAYGHLSAGLSEVWGEFAVGLVILVATLVLSMLYERAFCKYVCPLGAFNAILGRIPLFRIKRDAPTCISCSKCDKACPMNIDVSSPDAVKSAECIACMECVTACPTRKDTLKTTLAGKLVKMVAIVGIGFAIIAGAAVVGQAANMLRFAAKPLSALAAEGKLSIADIKGSSTYAQVADSFGLELERLYREAKVDAKLVPPDTKLKDTGALIGNPGFEADDIRFAVSRLTGIPYAGEKPAEGADKPEPVMSPATPPSTATAPQPTAAAAATPAASPAANAATAQTVVPAVTASAAPAQAASLKVPEGFELEGTMSVDDVAKSLGARAEDVIKKLGLPADLPRDKPLRDLKDAYGFSMPALKELIKK